VAALDRDARFAHRLQNAVALVSQREPAPVQEQRRRTGRLVDRRAGTSLARQRREILTADVGADSTGQSVEKTPAQCPAPDAQVEHGPRQRERQKVRVLLVLENADGNRHEAMRKNRWWS